MKKKCIGCGLPILQKRYDSHLDRCRGVRRMGGKRGAGTALMLELGYPSQREEERERGVASGVGPGRRTLGRMTF